MYFKILVPLDGSTLAERALSVARALARRCAADLELLTVVPDGDGDRSSATAAPYLAAIAEQAESESDPIKCHVVQGDAAPGIVDFTRSQGFSLIVMATHGRTGFVRGLLGSVTDQVILNSPVPVLVVNGGSAPVPDLGEMIDNVIIPLDGSELAESAIEHGEAVAEAFGADLALLRVAASNANSIERSLARHYLDGIASSLNVKGSEIKQHTPTGDPGETVIATGASLPNSLIVMTTRGTSGLKRRMRGSVADRVVRGTTVPTMVIPPVAAFTGRCMD
ncbi:MAG: universal stress protein [Dehalococcoidia bacterium]|jgi:nucleotide-binding universal stress UspA family protein|nr:universal stress protein [Dehalococcoidia bacterium]